MPAKSKQQFKFMKAVEGGYIRPKGLSKKEAKEFTESNVGDNSYDNLPKFKKTKKLLNKRS